MRLDVNGWFYEPISDDLAPGYSTAIAEPMCFLHMRGAPPIRSFFLKLLNISLHNLLVVIIFGCSPRLIALVIASLTVLLEKIELSAYPYFDVFVRDFHLICENCVKFNLPETAVHQDALRLHREVRPLPLKLRANREQGRCSCA